MNLCWKQYWQFAKCLDSQVSGKWRIFCFISISKFGSLNNPFAMITSLYELDLSFWYKQKKWFLWIKGAAQAVESHGDKWGLTWYFQWGICTSVPTWTLSQNSLAAAEALSEHEWTSLKWSQRPSQSAQE